MGWLRLVRQLWREMREPQRPMHYPGDCVACMTGHPESCAEYKAAHGDPYEGMMGTEPYTYEEFSKDCDRW